MARIVGLRQAPPAERESEGTGSIAVLCAGTSDLPVAEEAAVTAEFMGGGEVRRIYDVGVAGLHRLLAHREALREAEVVIVCAGMEGALPSVVVARSDHVTSANCGGYGAASGVKPASLGAEPVAASDHEAAACGPHRRPDHVERLRREAHLACTEQRTQRDGVACSRHR